MEKINCSLPKNKNNPKCKISCSIDGKQFCKIGDKSLKPPIARAGGKSKIANKIINKMPPHKVYVEPFVGGGAVFLKKPLAEKNVINDKDKDVVIVFKDFKKGANVKKCDLTPSKKRFDKIKKKPNKKICDVLYLNKLSFGSGMNSFSNKKSKTKRKDIGIIYQKNHNQDYINKLKNAVILNQDFEKVMKKYDSKDTLHYLDPPYVGSEKVYKENDSVNPERVCNIARKMRGKVIISYNNHPEVRKKCKGLKFHKINTKYTLSANSNNKKANELLITNF